MVPRPMTISILRHGRTGLLQDILRIILVIHGRNINIHSMTIGNQKLDNDEKLCFSINCIHSFAYVLRM